MTILDYLIGFLALFILAAFLWDRLEGFRYWVEDVLDDLKEWFGNRNP